jgi:hypothetical protein
MLTAAALESVKRDSRTWVTTAPVLGNLALHAGITVCSQNDPTANRTIKAMSKLQRMTGASCM